MLKRFTDNRLTPLSIPSSADKMGGRVNEIIHRQWLNRSPHDIKIDNLKHAKSSENLNRDKQLVSKTGNNKESASIQGELSSNSEQYVVSRKKNFATLEGYEGKGEQIEEATGSDVSPLEAWLAGHAVGSALGLYRAVKERNESSREVRRPTGALGFNLLDESYIIDFSLSLSLSLSFTLSRSLCFFNDLTTRSNKTIN